LQTLVLMLAIAGVGAILRSLARTVLRLGIGAAEESAATGMAEVNARRGDLTGLAERREAARSARRYRRLDVLQSLAWLLWLVVPPFAGLAPQAYAFAAPLWLIAAPRIRRPRGN
jgi:hypothetical protein